MKTLAAQYDAMKSTMRVLEKRHRVTKAKRREYVMLTARALRRALQKDKSHGL